jgi:lipopolysaccharide transport system ATP-binding protein
MYVRLAFAVAAHLQPEILILDEILAVGDLAFQNKCLNMIRDVSKNGRTVLFVSHNIRMINRLCTRGLVIENGKSIFDGDLNIALDHYIGKVDSKIKHEFCSINNKESHIHVHNVQLLVNGELTKKPILCFDEIDIVIKLSLNISLLDIIISMVVKNSDKEIVFMSEINDDDDGVNPSSSGLYEIKTFIPNPLLKPSRYSLTIGTNSQSMGQLNHFEDIIYFEIIDINSNRDTRPGYIYQNINWNVEKIS